LSKKTTPSRVKPELINAPQNTDFKVALWLGLVLFFFYLLTTSAHRPIGDEEEYVAVAASILTNGTPAIIKAQPSSDGRVQKTRTYYKFPLGHSLLLLPFVALQVIAQEIFPFGFAFVSHFFLNSLFALESAALCALLFLLVRLLGNVHANLKLSQSTTVAVALTTALATQIWPASRTLFADNSVAVFLTLAIYALLRFRYDDAGQGWAIIASCAAAMMIFCKNFMILAYPALAVYGIWAALEKKKQGKISTDQTVRLAIMAAMPFAIIVVTQLWYNHLRYGSVWLSGYHEGRDGDFGFSTPLLVGLYGIFLSSGRSFFLYSPMCLLAFLGARDFFKYAKTESALIAGASLPVVFAYAKWWSWHGGWEWGARFYVFLIPLLMWISTPAWRWLDGIDISARARKIRTMALTALFLVSISVQVLGILIHPMAYWNMTASDLKVLEHPMYVKGTWEIRDDMPLAHFVPEFSPVAAHAWLVWATWNRHRLGEQSLAAAAPWISLNPNWAPTNVKYYLGYDVWFVGNWIDPWLEQKRSVAPLVVVALSLVVMGLFSGINLGWHLRRSAPPPSRKV